MKKFLFCLGALLGPFLMLGQDPLFFNTSQSLIYLNPSFAGSNGLFRTQSLYRVHIGDQSFSSATLYNGADVYIKSLKGGLALTHLLNNYGQGKLKTNILALSYAQYFSFPDNHLKVIPSIQVAYLQKELDLTRLTFGEQMQPGFVSQWQGPDDPVSSLNKRNVDFSSGILVNYYENFYFGAGVFHVSQPNDGLLGDSRLPARLSVHSSLNERLMGTVDANFFAQYQRQGNNNYVSLKMNFSWKHLILGFGYFLNSANNGGSMNVGYRNKYFIVGLGYDQYLTKLKQKNGAWEMQFSLNIRDKPHRKLGGVLESL